MTTQKPNLSLIVGSWPVPGQIVITQKFNVNPQDYAKFGYPGHNGIDIGTKSTPIGCYTDGEIIRAEFDQTGYGFLVIVKHLIDDLAFETLYAHLRNIAVRVGQKIQEGELIGVSDSTGNSTGDHLHFEIRVPALISPSNPWKKGQIDPAPHFKATSNPDRPVVIPGGLVVKVGDVLRVSVNATPWLNLRSSPATAPTNDIGDLYPGTVLPPITEVKGDWVGFTAWTHKGYLTK